MRSAGTIAVAVAIAVAATASADSGKGFWKVLATPKAKWVLRDSTPPSGKPRTITVETYDVRTIDRAAVARLRWTLASGSDKQDISGMTAGTVTQVAVTAAGLYLLSADMDDAKVREALKQRPSRSDPPKPYTGTEQNHGRYLEITDDGNACLGEGPMPDAGPCDDVCDARLCVSATDGIVELMGNWAPDQSSFQR